MAGPAADGSGPDPRQHGQRGQDGPDGEAGLPVTAQRVGQGHGRRRGDGGAEGEGHRVEAGHGTDPVGEVALDDDRHQDVADRDAHQCQGGGGQEAARAAGVRADQQARGDGDHAGADHRAGSEAAGQPGSGDSEDGEAERGYGGEQSGDAAAHAEPVADLLQEGAQARDGGAQVHRGQDDAEDEQTGRPGRPRARGGRLAGYLGHNAPGTPLRACPRLRLRTCFRTCLGTCLRPGFVTSHETHHRIMG